MKLEVEVDNEEQGRDVDAVGLYLATSVYKQTRMRARHWYTAAASGSLMTSSRISSDS